ncbi:MAG: hypothetical protein IKY67_14995, partial [Paludibacteraceae bacterium]|nr:hypothetical protein [Paludibacteraceae bacterium]
MKNLSNRYFYEVHYTVDDNGKIHRWNGDVYADRKNRLYKTKMKPNDLPEYYCEVQRYGYRHDIINASGVVDIAYSWVKENHFIKDSVLRISYTGELKPYYKKYNFNGKEVVSFLPSYTNEDELIFGNSIFKFLAYCKKYSRISLNKVRKSFIEQCEWLKNNQPGFAPHSGKDENGNTVFPDFGEWFDNKI